MLQIDEANLNTKRMLDLMAVSSIQGGGLPLYLHILSRILRMLRSEQQTNGGSFQYQRFKAAIEQENLTPGQKAPLSQRLDTLESFMVRGQVSAPSSSFRRLESRGKGNDWTPKVSLDPGAGGDAVRCVVDQRDECYLGLVPKRLVN